MFCGFVAIITFCAYTLSVGIHLYSCSSLVFLLKRQYSQSGFKIFKNSLITFFPSPWSFKFSCILCFSRSFYYYFSLFFVRVDAPKQGLSESVKNVGNVHVVRLQIVENMHSTLLKLTCDIEIPPQFKFRLNRSDTVGLFSKLNILRNSVPNDYFRVRIFYHLSGLHENSKSELKIFNYCMFLTERAQKLVVK